MNFINLDLSIFILILSFVGIFGLYGYKKVKSESSYLFADRKAGFFALMPTLVMTEFNTATLIAFSSLGYYAGVRALLLPLIFLIAISFYAVVVAKKWKDFNGGTVAEFFSKKYDKRLGRSVSLILFLAMSCFTAAYIKSLGMIFLPLFPEVSMWLLSAVLVFVVLLITLRGGLVSIIQIDVLSFLLACVFFPALLYFAANNIGDVASSALFIDNASSVLPSRFVVSLICISMFTYILAPWYGQKIFAAKTRKVAFSSTVVAALLVFLLYGCAVLAVALLRIKGTSLSDIEYGFPQAVNFFLPAGWRGFGYSIIFIAGATTLAGVWSAMSTMVIVDFLPAKWMSKFSRCLIVTLFIALFTYILSNTFIDRIFDKMILANIPIFALSFALLAGFYWKRVSCVGAYCSIFVGLVWGIATYIIFGESGGYTWYWGVYGLPIIFFVGITFSLLFPDNKKMIKSLLYTET